MPSECASIGHSPGPADHLYNAGPGASVSAGDWCCQIAFTPRELPAKEVAFAASTRCEGEKRDA